MAERQRFCIRCGSTLQEGQHICTQCGGSDGQVPEGNVDVRVISGNKVRMNWAIILLLVYGIFSLVEGIFAAFFAEQMVDYIEMIMKTDIQSIFGSGMTRGEIIRMLTIEGYISLFSGAFATIAGILCVKRMNLVITLSCILVASFMVLSELLFYPKSDVFMLVMQFLLGLLVFRMVYYSRSVFIS